MENNGAANHLKLEAWGVHLNGYVHYPHPSGGPKPCIQTMDTLCKPFLCRWRNLLGRHFVILNLSHTFCHQISINKVLFLKWRETS